MYCIPYGLKCQLCIRDVQCQLPIAGSDLFVVKRDLVVRKSSAYIVYSVRGEGVSNVIDVDDEQ